MIKPAVRVALVAVFAALQATLGVIPYTLTLGISGQITLGLVGGSLIGLLLGPVTGGLAVLVGSLVGVFLNPGGAIFGFLTPLAPLLGAVSAGCVKRRRGYLGGIIIVAALVVFAVHPYGREAFAYAWLQVVAAVVAFLPLHRLIRAKSSEKDPTKSEFLIPVAAFVGVMADHAVGSAVAMWYFSPAIPPEFWLAAMPIYPIERVVATVIVTAIAMPVYYALAKAGFLNAIE